MPSSRSLLIYSIGNVTEDMSVSTIYLFQLIVIFIAFSEAFVWVTITHSSPNLCAANRPIPFLPALVRLKRGDVGL